MLKVTNVDVFYGDIQVLWDISFEVHKGETVALLGANGAGKSTIMKTIAGLLRPQKGEIEFLGKFIHTIPSHEMINRGISLVPEGRELFVEMSVLENLEMGALNVKSRVDINESLDYVFGLFPALKKRRNQIAGTLSGGEQQMVAIGRGLMSNPKLFMFDEPSLGLAPLIVEEIFRAIADIKKRDITILIVEQNVKHTLLLSDRGYVLENGMIVLTGSGEQLLSTDHVKQAYLGG